MSSQLQVFVVENPLAGVEVSLIDTPFDALTGVDGSVTFTGITGIAKVVAADPVNKVSAYTSLTVGGAYNTLTLILRDSFDQTGFTVRVVDTNGNPVNGAKVVAEQTDIPGGVNNYITKNTLTNSSGFATLFGFNPLHFIHVVVDLGAAGLVFAPKVDPKVSQFVTAPDIVIPAAPTANGQINLTITHNGTPVVGATVTGSFEGSGPSNTSDSSGDAVLVDLAVGPNNFPYIWKVTITSTGNPVKVIQVPLMVSNHLITIGVSV